MAERRRCMALQAEQVHVAVLQHVRICATVRDMARRAAFDLHGSMREDKRTLLIGVAFEAGIVAGIGGSDLTHQMIGFPRPCGAMLVMTISAFHQPLVHAVTERHIELGSLLQMASVAKLWLLLDQQVFIGGRVVWRMAADTTDVV